MMEEMYGFEPTIDYSEPFSVSPEDLISPADYQNLMCSGDFPDRMPFFGSDSSDHMLLSAPSTISEVASITPDTQQGALAGREEAMWSEIKAKIVSHPRYPRLLEAYIDCQKVGAPPEIACLLDGIRREYDIAKRTAAFSSRFGADPELDQFMESYCDILVKYKSDLSRPFDEATTFLNKIELQLSNLCNGASRSCIYDEAGVSSEEDFSGGDLEGQDAQTRNEDQKLKNKLLGKYRGYISTLKQEFSKKKKKGKLPREARQTLLDWWNIHYKWPYPTEADKIALAETTGLDQKQINNWFINQRKRHWKPSDNMQLAVMDSLSGPFFMED